MPLAPTASLPIVDDQDDVRFDMRAPDGTAVPCRADRDYVIAIAADDRRRDLLDIFDEMRSRIELEASETYDLHGTDQNGEVRLAPLIA